jgi:hypothetical protein
VAAGPRIYAPRMRDLETIDSELRLLAAVRWSIREHGGEPSSRQVDKLLDERLAPCSPIDYCDDNPDPAHYRRGRLRRVNPLARPAGRSQSLRVAVLAHSRGAGEYGRRAGGWRRGNRIVLVPPLRRPGAGFAVLPGGVL